MIYPIKEISEAVYTMGDHEDTLNIEYDCIKMKTKFFWRVLLDFWNVNIWG